MQLQTDVDLTPYNTFGLSVQARHFVSLTDVTELPDILASDEYLTEPVLWLGGGSNVILTQDFPGLVVHMATKGVAFEEASATHVWVDVAAGEVWHDFVNQTLAAGFCGLENLSLIPGTVGAAPVQNIGAYGVEVKDVIEHVVCFDLQAYQVVTLSNVDCQFAYRDSVFKQGGKGRYVILNVRFKLKRHFDAQTQYGDIEQELLRTQPDRQQWSATDVATAVCTIRARKLPDPKVLGNAGSFFKNPILDEAAAAAFLQRHPDAPHYPMPGNQVKLAAGWLIDQLGLKGHQIGGAAVHAQQALVLVNKAQATAADVVALAADIQARVLAAYQVSLESEPNFI
ncbi:MAG: UDP-N-acetylmuramate dehydrogenase [Neisseriaceae bacterium]|nr:UDP-N-acetylmuramate dehydrogenase [Neisseriaceae bacterium]MBP6861139.1 UDP-N-acetylmuramate dehydrogenase [Neisseriaceae bacterium]